MTLNHIRFGHGKPLLLVHGLGGSWRSWTPVLALLGAQREVVAIDLPGFGASVALDHQPSIDALADAVEDFLEKSGLRGVDAVGSSLGARVVLELARRGSHVGAVVALDPGGFWQRWQAHVFFVSVWLSVRLLAILRPLLDRVLRSRAGRSLLLARLSSRPTALAPAIALEEMRGYARKPAMDSLLYQLAYREPQRGAPPGSIAAPLVIGWGRADRVCPPAQAARALALFPDARLHWFEHCGHFPHWDAPEATVKLILETTGAAPRSAAPTAGSPPSTSARSVRGAVDAGRYGAIRARPC